MIRRYHLPRGSAAAGVVARRCAASRADVARYALVATDDDAGVTAYARVRSERSRHAQHRTTRPPDLVIEVDLSPGHGGPARRADLRVPVAGKFAGVLLQSLSMACPPDRCVVGYGTWGDARLQLEEREHRLLVEVHAPDGWETPAEWVGAVDVTGDPLWARPVLTRESWPVTFRDPPAQPADPWRGGVDPTPASCEDDQR